MEPLKHLHDFATREVSIKDIMTNEVMRLVEYTWCDIWHSGHSVLMICSFGPVVKLAVVSNFDSRLRPILRDLQVDTL